MNRIFAWTDRQIGLPTDTDVERARKRSVLVARGFSLTASLIYGVIFLGQVYYWPAALAAVFFVSQTVNTVVLFRTRRIAGSMVFTIGITILVTFIAQIALGGFVQSGGVSMIMLVSPVFALLGIDRRAGLRTFILVLILVAGLALFEPQIRASAPAVPEQLSFTLLVVNVFVVVVLVFTLTAMIASEMESARARADGLLLNILPGPIAEQLKRHPDTIADGFDEVTVLFADIVDFTKLSADADPRDVVSLLNSIFSDFDELALRHGLEKIKTIGDAYMVAGGLPLPRPDHDVAVVEFALDMLKALELRRAWNDQPIRVRVGINTGPVVAGVIGRHKFIYDLWGDAVNTASRMESYGLANTIQVTESTYERLKNRFDFEARGAVNIKGKGNMNTYILRGPKTAAAI